jgi:hypothetical protein
MKQVRRAELLKGEKKGRIRRYRIKQNTHNSEIQNEGPLDPQLAASYISPAFV